MSSEETNNISFNLSPTLMWSILGIALSTLSTGGYFAITKYNQITELVDNYSPYNDAELRRQLAGLEAKLAGLESSVNGAKDAMVQTSNQLVSVSDKASIAKGEAMEAKAISNGSAREMQAALAGVREETKSMREGIEAKMKALQRATTNPLGN
jgi:chromosome segregation ATPase